MKTALLIAVPGGALFTAFAWRISELLSPDAIGMALGMMFGVLAGLPAAALVLVASRRPAAPAGDEVHFYGLQDTGRIHLKGGGFDGVYHLDAPTTYADEVTPYSHLARRAMQLPPLPERQAQVDELETQVDPRRFVVRWEGETR